MTLKIKFVIYKHKIIYFLIFKNMKALILFMILLIVWVYLASNIANTLKNSIEQSNLNRQIQINSLLK